MKISVIIPAYNGEKWIAQCLESVLYQSYTNLEVIVIDDGSMDRTAEIAAEIAAVHPVVRVLSQPNSGLSASRNRGVAEATGDYIHFFDVDDIVNLDYYARMVEAIGQTGADMAFGGMVNEALPVTSMMFEARVLLSSADDKISVTNAGNMAYAWRYLIRRAFLQESGLAFETGMLMEDMAFTLQAVVAARRIVTVPGAIYYYMNREGSILNSRNREFARKRARDLGKAKAFRREFLDANSLRSPVKPIRTVQYKLFGIPMARKIVYNHGKSKFYIFGLRILQTKDIR